MVSDHNFAPSFPNLAGHCAAKILHLTLSDHLRHPSPQLHSCMLPEPVALSFGFAANICTARVDMHLRLTAWPWLGALGQFWQKNRRLRPMVFSFALTASTLHHQMLDDFNFQTQTLPQPNSILYPPKDALYLAA